MRSRWSRILFWLGAVTMVVGAADPLEGAFVILLGSALLVVGETLKNAARRNVGFWTCVFVLIAVGVAAMFGLSAVGGIGGSTGRSLWWSVLILPYPIGWLLGVGRLVAAGLQSLRSGSPSKRS